MITLRFGGERRILLCILRLFTGVIPQLSLKNAWLPPVFFLDFGGACWDLRFLGNRKPGQKYL